MGSGDWGVGIREEMSETGVQQVQAGGEEGPEEERGRAARTPARRLGRRLLHLLTGMWRNPIVLKELRARMRGWRAAVVLTVHLIAAGLWLVMALRSIVSVVLVRAQLRRAKGQPFREPPVHLAAAGSATQFICDTLQVKANAKADIIWIVLIVDKFISTSVKSI